MVNNKGAPSDSLLVEQELLTIMEHQIEFIPGFGGVRVAVFEYSVFSICELC
jgi:hypothetical protein